MFNPVDLDTDQWVSTAKSFGAKYYVLVADHFSGFSLYPTSAHNYSIAHTIWGDGKRDIVQEFVSSCRK
jgi:alpha-L-fucosidase